MVYRSVDSLIGFSCISSQHPEKENNLGLFYPKNYSLIQFFFKECEPVIKVLISAKHEKKC